MTVLEALYRAEYSGMVRLAYTLVGSNAEAEEIVQEVFLRVVRAKDRYERTAKFTTWIYAIARNLCVDESRRARFRDHKSLDAKQREELIARLERIEQALVRQADAR